MSVPKAYMLCLLIFFTIDFFCLGILAKNWYRIEIGHLLDSILWISVIGFYLLYSAEILVLTVYPLIKTGSWQRILLNSASLALVTCAAFDLRNPTFLKNLPMLLGVCDKAWGTFVTNATSIILFNIKSFFIK